MCKCDNEKKDCKMVAVDIADFVATVLGTALVSEPEKKTIGQNIDLDKEIEKVIFNNPATIVFCKDGDKTAVKCHDGDTYNKETGLAMCIVRKLTGNRRYNEVFEKYCK